MKACLIHAGDLRHCSDRDFDLSKLGAFCQLARHLKVFADGVLNVRESVLLGFTL